MFFFLGLIQAQESHPLAFVESALGDTVTLHCKAEYRVSNYLFWYKQSPGYLPEIVTSKLFDSITLKPHFNLTLTEDKDACVFHLIIQNVTKGDEANYFCQQYSREKWNNFTFLSVIGKINFHCSYSISREAFQEHLDESCILIYRSQ